MLHGRTRTQGRKGPLGSIHWATTCPSGTKPSQVSIFPTYFRETAGDGAPTASPGNLSRCLTTLTVGKFFLISKANLSHCNLSLLLPIPSPACMENGSLLSPSLQQEPFMYLEAVTVCYLSLLLTKQTFNSNICKQALAFQSSGCSLCPSVRLSFLCVCLEARSQELGPEPAARKSEGYTTSPGQDTITWCFSPLNTPQQCWATLSLQSLEPL